MDAPASGAADRSGDPQHRTDAWPLACPVCNAGLTHGGRVFVCPTGHAFDQSRDGYVNLLVQQHRERGIDGDTLDMLRSRRSFLDAGYYRPLLDRLVLLVDARLDDTERGVGRMCVAEVGCGEGYYIGGIAARARAGDRMRCVGLDVSRDAVRLAARKHADVMFAVANVRRRLYLSDGSASVLLSVFAPRNAAEFARVTAPGGSVIIVIPGEDHLASLRGEHGLIGIQESKEDRVLEQFEGVFTAADRSALTYPLDLTADAVRELIAMGPNRWHTDASGRTGVEPASTTASFVILQLTKCG
jgi:SAM-dependent methyltransferase